MIGHVTHVIDIEKVELVKTTIWVFGDSHRFCDKDFKEVVIWSLIVRSDSCDWRWGRILRWTGFREKRQQSDEYLPVNSDWRSKLNSRRVHVKDRLQVAICEPVEVDDDGDGRHLRKTADQRNRSHLREMNIASYSIQTSPACIAWLESSLDWTVL